MDTWHDMGERNQQAARQLTRSQQYRSALSRAYYAAFAFVTEKLAAANVHFGVGRSSPAHRDLRHLVAASLAQHWAAAQAQEVDRALADLYKQRLNADYVDGWRPTRAAAKDALLALETVVRALRALP